MLPLSSQWVLIKFSMCSPTCSAYRVTFIPYDSGEVHMLSSFHLYKWAKGKELYISKQNLLLCAASIVSFFLSDRPIKLTCCKKEKNELERAPHLIINRKSDKQIRIKMPTNFLSFNLGSIVQLDWCFDSLRVYNCSLSSDSNLKRERERWIYYPPLLSRYTICVQYQMLKYNCTRTAVVTVALLQFN